MDNLDEWLARVTVGIGIAVAISKESRSWYQVLKEQNKKAKIAPKFRRRRKRAKALLTFHCIRKREKNQDENYSSCSNHCDRYRLVFRR